MSTTAAGAAIDGRTLEQALANCSAEPIHVPGAIQPHGWLLLIDESDWSIAQASANLLGLLPAGFPDAPGSCSTAVLAGLLGEPLMAAIGRAAAEPALERPLHVGVWNRDSQCCDVLVHRGGDGLLVELEPGEANTAPEPVLTHRLVRQFVAGLQGASDDIALCQLAASETQAITGFGRVLVYRFDDDGHGEVLAESLQPGYDSYLGHRFPAADLPLQARQLYLRNPWRLIRDAGYTPAPLVPALHPRSGRPTDLSFASLRSVSPVHREYMRNMGTLASMSVSVIVNGRLWGLVSCHHAQPRGASWQVRMGCEHLAQLLGLQLEARESRADAERGAALRRSLVELVGNIVDSGGTLENLADSGSELLHFGSASGAAVLSGGNLRLVGRTPAAIEVEALSAWLAAQRIEVYSTDRLGEVFPQAAGYAEVATGVLAISVSQVHHDYVMWFRPELVRSVQWAGNPHKPLVASEGTPRLHPRRSFSTWTEELRGRAEPWGETELATAAEFRHALLNIVLRRAEEMAELAGELGRINKELEAFSYSVSHDLRAPLRHIAGYADLIRDYDGGNLSERGQRFLGNIKEAAGFAGALVDGLLSFSQMGRTALRPTWVDMDALVRGIVRNLRVGGASDAVEWTIEPLPAVWVDPVFMQVAMENLLGNALKYSSTRSVPKIAVSASQGDDEDVIRVRDNGVGFDMRYVGKLFGVFQRLHAVEEFEGTGIGLASVRRAIERHGGRVQAWGEPGVGAEFSIFLPRAGAEAQAAADPTP